MKQQQEKLTLHKTTNRPWLSAVYEARRQRVVTILEKTISILTENQQSISLSSLVQASRDIDPKGQGISESAILNNPIAKNLYEKNRTWKPKRRSSQASCEENYTNVSIPKKQCYHLKKLSKTQLIGRLLKAEREAAEYKEHWLTVNEKLFALGFNPRN